VGILSKKLIAGELCLAIVIGFVYVNRLMRTWHLNVFVTQWHCL